MHNTLQICVLGSRLAIWMLKEADVKIYLIASDDTRAKRILNREGGDLDEIKRFTAMRDREDSARYQKLYGIDNGEYEFADLKIDTATGVIENLTTGDTYKAHPLPGFVQDIAKAGGLIPYIKSKRK